MSTIPPDSTPKTFGTATAADIKPPVEFAIGYIERRDGTPGSLTLHALTDRGLATIEALTTGVMQDEASGRPRYNPAAVIRFFQATLVPEDTEPFLRLMDDKARLVKMDDLGDAMAWLCEEITGRPLATVGASSPGTPATNGGASAGGPTVV